MMKGESPNPERELPESDPCRDSRFIVKERWSECVNLPDGHPQKLVEFLHRQMNEEIDALECSARSLTDFPDAPWEIRLFLARQCSDEARHALMFRTLFLARGGTIGMFPVLNFQYRIICAFDTLVARLAVQNRTFEAEGIDAIEHGIRQAQLDGDSEYVALLEGQFADEIQHVRIANEFIRDMVRQEPRLALRVAQALHDAQRKFVEAIGEAGTAVTKYEPSASGRREAGFAPEEIAVAQALAARRMERARSTDPA